MIKHERQYASTKEWIARFERSIAEIRSSPGSADALDAEKRELLGHAQEGLRDRLRAEVAEYEALRSGAVGLLAVSSFGSLAEALIKARIAAGLTQRQLAERLRVGEDVIERYEATDYEAASLACVVEVADALGLRITAEVLLPDRAEVPGESEDMTENPADPSLIPAIAGE